MQHKCKRCHCNNHLPKMIKVNSRILVKANCCIIGRPKVLRDQKPAVNMVDWADLMNKQAHMLMEIRIVDWAKLAFSDSMRNYLRPNLKEVSAPNIRLVLNRVQINPWWRAVFQSQYHISQRLQSREVYLINHHL